MYIYINIHINKYICKIHALIEFNGIHLLPLIVSMARSKDDGLTFFSLFCLVIHGS